MSLAEQKEEMFKIIKAADEKTLAKLIGFAQHLDKQQEEFSGDDLAEFQRRSEAHSKNPSASSPWDEALSRIRNKISQ